MNVLDISVLKDKRYSELFKNARKFLMFLMYGSTFWFFVKKMKVIELTRSYTDLPFPVNCTRGHFQTWEIKRDIRFISSF